MQSHAPLLPGLAEAFLRDSSCPGIPPAPLPDPALISTLIAHMRQLLFPFCSPETDPSRLYHETARLLASQIAIALGDHANNAPALTASFLTRLPEIRRLLHTDLQAAYDGDPAAASPAEILLAYPGFYAVTVHRLAHALHTLGIPLLPRIMTELAHARTGIDLHPGAVIGPHFFIDHGTGVVIGETAVIGRQVKLYHGVTLGALSTRGGQHLRGTRRHPTIEDRVTIYSGASVLGGDTVIGHDAVIGANAFITSSIAPGTRVSGKHQAPEMQPGKANW